MKRLVCVLLFAIFVLNVFSQNEAKTVVKGFVYDITEHPIANASVYSLNGQSSVLTSADGYFEVFVQCPDSVVITCLGYKDVSVFAPHSEMFFESLTMEYDGVNIKPVVVKGITSPASMASSTITRETIATENAVRDIPFLLESQPSVVATSETGTGTGYTSMRIRGTDMSRINVTIDGIPLNDAESQDVYWVNMGDFSSAVTKVDLQRGVGTSTNGTASFGASMNLETQKDLDDKYVQISGAVGSFGTKKIMASVATGLIDSCLSLDARFSNVEYDGWIDRGNGKLQSFDFGANFSKGKHSLSAKIMGGKQKTGITWNGVPSDSVEKGNLTFNEAGMYYDKVGNLCFYPNETDNYKQIHYVFSYKYFSLKKLTFDCSVFATKGLGFYEQYRDDANLSNYGFSSSEQHDLIRQKWMDNIFYGYVANLQYEKALGKIVTFMTLGHSCSIYDCDHYGKITWIEDDFVTNYSGHYYDNRGLKKDFNVFMKLKQYHTAFPNLKIYLDGQFRSINYQMTGFDDDLTEMNHIFNWRFFNPKVGFIYDLKNADKITASLSVANREPTRSNLKDAAKQLNAKELQAETLYDFELGYRKVFRKLAFIVNGYYMQYDNQLVQTGKLNDVGDAFLENVKNSYRRGLEFTVEYHPIPKIELVENVTVSQNKIKNYVEYAAEYDSEWNEIQKVTDLGTTDISYSPNIIASTKIVYNPIKNLTLNLNGKFVGKQYFDNSSNENRMLDAYWVCDFHVGYVWKFAKKSSFDVQFLVNNLFNKNYICNAYGGNWYEQGVEHSWMYYFPQAGRNYTLKATLTF